MKLKKRLKKLMPITVTKIRKADIKIFKETHRITDMLPADGF